MAKPLLVEIYADASQYSRTLDKAAGRTKRFGAAAKLAGGLLVTGLAVGLEESVKAAVHAEQSQARLEQAFKNAHIAIGPLKGSIDELEASGRKLGFTDEQTKQSLGSLIVSTGNYKQSVTQLGIAQDLARFKSVDLETATKALTMAHAGSLRPLKQLGIDIPKVTAAQDALKAATKDHTTETYKDALATAKLQDKQATFKNVLQTVTDKVHGQSKAYSETAAGGMAQFNAQVEHIKVELGKNLLPILNLAVERVNHVASEFDKLNSQIKPATELIGRLADRFGFLFKAMMFGLDPTTRTLFLFRGIASVLQAVTHWAEAAAAAVEDLVRSLGHIHVPNLHLPSIHVPHLAAGGIVTRPTMAMIGEAGPEAVVPLNGRASMGAGTVVFNFPNYYGDRQELMQMIRREVTQLRRRGGTF